MSFRVWHKKLISQGAGFDVYQASSSDDNIAPWEHDTTRQERDHVIIDEKLDTELDLD